MIDLWSFIIGLDCGITIGAIVYIIHLARDMWRCFKQRCWKCIYFEHETGLCHLKDRRRDENSHGCSEYEPFSQQGDEK